MKTYDDDDDDDDDNAKNECEKKNGGCTVYTQIESLELFFSVYYNFLLYKNNRQIFFFLNAHTQKFVCF